MNLHRRATLSVATLALFAFGAGPAPAATEQEITDALKALVAAGESGSTLELGAPKVDGDKLIFTDAVVKTVTPEGPGEAKIKTLTVTGGDVNAEGGLVADGLSAETIDMTSGTEKVTIGSVNVVNLEATPKAANAKFKGRFDSATATDIKAESNGQPPVTIASISAETSDFVGDVPRNATVAVEGMDIDVANSPDDPTGGQLKALGYDRVTVNLFGGGTWDDAAGSMSLDELTVDIDNVGSLTLTGTFGGFTPEVIAELQKPEPSPDLMQKITVEDASVSFTDNSVTGKVLDMQAGQMGTDRAAFVEQITAALPLMLSAVGNPGFQEKLATAATAFLKDPKNISITASPASPVDLMTLMMTGQTEPQKLPDILGAEVTANEPDAE